MREYLYIYIHTHFVKIFFVNMSWTDPWIWHRIPETIHKNIDQGGCLCISHNKWQTYQYHLRPRSCEL